MITKNAMILLLMTTFLTLCILFCYLGYPDLVSRSYGLKLSGAYAYFTATFVGFSISYLLKRFWDERANLTEVLSPSKSRLILCAVIAFLTPVGNVFWIPIPLGALVILMGGHLAVGGIVTVFLLTAAAYGVACLSAAHTHEFNRVVLPTVLYLIGGYAAVTLFMGIGSI